MIDPAGRETDYAYASNGIDLLTVLQKHGAGSDLLETHTYNSQHEPLTSVDAAGQTTTNTYFTNGKVHTITDAKGDVSTMGLRQQLESDFRDRAGKRGMSRATSTTVTGGCTP